MYHLRVLALVLVAACPLAVGCSSKSSNGFFVGPSGELTTTTQPVVKSNVDNVYFGDPLPAPTTIDLLNVSIPNGKVEYVILTSDAERPAFLKDDTLQLLGRELFPYYDGNYESGRVNNKSFATFTANDPIVVPLTGAFRLFSPHVFSTKVFNVTGRQPAYVQCLDSTVLAGAASQSPPSLRAKVGSCVMTRGGGTTVGRIIQHATCTSPKGMSVCEYNAAEQACISPVASMAERRAPGDAVTISWDGGDVPAGSADLVVPADIEIGDVPVMHSIKDNLEVTFQGGQAGAQARMTLAQFPSNSTVTVDCDVDASSGRFVLPWQFFVALDQGEAQISFSSFGITKVTNGEWETEVTAPGRTNQNGVIISAPFKVQLVP